MGVNIGRMIAAAGALTGGYLSGRRMAEERDWEKEKREREREDWARQEAERAAAAETLGKVGTETYDPAEASSALRLSPEQRTIMESDIATFGPEGAKATVNDTTSAAAGGVNVKPRTYTREQAAEDFSRRMYAINPTKAMQVEASMLGLDEVRDKADSRKKLKRVDQELRAWGEKRFQPGEDGRPSIDDDGMVHLGKMRVLLLSREGLFDDAMKTAEQSMQYATRKIQAESVQRAAETDKALALFDRGDYSAAMKVYDMVPDGSRATNIAVGKDGSVIVSRESSVDGAKLPDARFKNISELRASIEAMKDPNAVINHVERTFKRDIETRRLGMEGRRVALAEQAHGEARNDKDSAAKAGVALYGEMNPKATPAQLEAVRAGVIPAVPKEGGYKTEFNEVASALGTPAVDEKGKPITDMMTGRQVINRNPDAEAAFFKWAQSRGYKDTNKAIPIYLAEKASAGAAKPASEKDAHDQASAAIKAGASREAVNSRLKQWGFAEIK